MLVRVRLVGNGTRQFPHGALLPTYTEVLTLVDQGVVYAIIGEADHPKLDEHPSAKFEQTGHGAALIALDSIGHKAWHDHLDDRYQERKGEFRPEIA